MRNQKGNKNIINEQHKVEKNNKSNGKKNYGNLKPSQMMMNIQDFHIAILIIGIYEFHTANIKWIVISLKPLSLCFDIDFQLDKKSSFLPQI